MPKRVTGYVDGFNLYWGSLHGSPYRWLDLLALVEDLFRGHTVDRVKYFTARVDDRPDDPGQSQRQDVLLKALGVHCAPRLEIHLGNFATHKRMARLVTPLADGRRFAKVYRTEEKASDVNLGAHLVWDACHRAFDVACVVSNDSDLQTPVDMAVRLGAEVVTVNPHLHRRQPRCLFGTGTRRLTRGRLARNLLPDPVVAPDGVRWCCPASWKS
ncbi:MAG TPA: NYN domain-containing protein [Acidimicrobiales bacterium]